jgi:uncharacterized membrane protein
MQYIAAFVLSGMLSAEAYVLASASEYLPVRVASHFNTDGYANGFMLRADYQLLMMGLGIGIPILLVLVVVVLPYCMPHRLRIPSRDYWIAPPRRNETLNTIVTSGLTMGCIVTAFMIAVHLLVVEANNRTPPRLDNTSLYALIALLLMSIIIWQFILWRRFQVPR